MKKQKNWSLLDKTPPFKHRSSDENKINPHSLLTTLWEISNKLGNINNATKILNKYNNRGRNKDNEITAYKYRRTMSDDMALSYRLIESHAMFLGIPSFIVLLLSRMRSNSEKYHTNKKINEKNLIENKAILRTLAEISKSYKPDSDFNIEILEEWASIFLIEKTKIELDRTSINKDTGKD